MPWRACNALGRGVRRSRRSFARACGTCVLWQARRLVASGRHRPIRTRRADAIAHRRARLAHETPGFAMRQVCAHCSIFARTKRAARTRDTHAIRKRRRLGKDALASQALGCRSARSSRIVVVVPRIRGAHDLGHAAPRAVRTGRAHVAVYRTAAFAMSGTCRAAVFRNARGLVWPRRRRARITRRAGLVRRRRARAAHVGVDRARPERVASRRIRSAAEGAARTCGARPWAGLRRRRRDVRSRSTIAPILRRKPARIAFADRCTAVARYLSARAAARAPAPRDKQEKEPKNR
jgi:hypothetical protein